MNKFLIYVLGIITGVILAYAFSANRSGNSGIAGLEMFEEPGDTMEYRQFEVLQVAESGCALAYADVLTIVLIVPDEGQQLYDGQKIVLKSDQCAQRVGTYKYTTQKGIDKTVPAVSIVDGVELPESVTANNDSRKTLFEKPGDCVSRKDFEVQKVLESGDAIALEVRKVFSGYVSTSDLEVLILAREGDNFYNNQIVKAPDGKCARQIGNYKYKKFEFGETTVIPIIAFM